MQLFFAQRSANPNLLRFVLPLCLCVVPSVSKAQLDLPATAPPPVSSADSLPSAPAPSADSLALALSIQNSSQSSSSSSSRDAQQTPAAPAQLKQQPQQQPSSSEPSLGDLGLSPSQTQPDRDLQARLDRHTQMLKIHQRLGLITLAPLAAACISSAAAPPDPRNGSGNTVGRDIHVSLGSLSVVMYGLTASYAIRAPRISEGPARGGIKIHKYLIFIHAPGMILTPILGAMAFNQANNGEKVHGIASAHAAVAWTTVAAYTAAIVAVSWPIHLKL
ncbi:MAG TPA: hypothetical protein VHY48_05630 [Acidobacteriaceae bacterium]|nr:hypothetical protein [Acidobacteriaceae bacterium]